MITVKIRWLDGEEAMYQCRKWEVDKNNLLRIDFGAAGVSAAYCIPLNTVRVWAVSQ